MIIKPKLHNYHISLKFHEPFTVAPALSCKMNESSYVRQALHWEDSKIKSIKWNFILNFSLIICCAAGENHV